MAGLAFETNHPVMRKGDHTMNEQQGKMNSIQRLKRSVVFGVAAAGLLVGLPVLGQSSDPSGWDVDSIITRCAENVCRRYNLNDEQCDQTHKIFEAEVNEFIDDNAQELWPLMRDMIQIQNGKLPSAESAQAFAKRALPLMGKIENAIKDANNRWSEILTDEQKELWDWDMNQMDGTFSQIVDNVKEVEKGNQNMKQLIPSTPAKGPGMPSRPSKPKPGIPSLRDDLRPEDEWSTYVRQFIEDYELDESQSSSARAILADLLEQADNYRESRKSEFESAERDAQDIFGKDRATQMAADDRLKKLNEPLKKYREQLEQRLNSIPRDAQRAKFENSGRSVIGSTKRRVPRSESVIERDADSSTSSDGKPTRLNHPTVEKKAKPNR
jgi:hypothetical protein